ncbi:MAG: hypothetical protein AAGG68_30285, partial [Bacteroidota bacterium]
KVIEVYYGKKMAEKPFFILSKPRSTFGGSMPPKVEKKQRSGFLLAHIFCKSAICYRYQLVHRR